MRTLAVATLLLTVAAAGCLGGEKRSEWAYDITSLDGTGRTGRGVTVAVLDTGVNVGHVALDHLVDGDLDDGELVAFKDYIGGQDGVANAYDPDGHGSHVVGILAGKGSSTGDKLAYGGVELRGGAPNVRLVVARVCTDESCDSAAIPEAIRWAVRSQHADILSLSLGGEAGLEIPVLLQDDLRAAVDEAIDAGVVVVAAAGNDDASQSDVNSPADVEGAIAVGAVGRDGQVADFSNEGDPSRNRCPTIPIPGLPGRCAPNQKPELVAPGVDILSTWTGDGYATAKGTSQAVPFVTAAVALMLEGKPDLIDRDGVLRVKEVLASTARPVEGQVRPHDNAAGYGIVNAAQAVSQYR